MDYQTLNKSISEMSDEELAEHLKKIRADRRTVNRAPAKKKSTAAKPLRVKDKEQAQALLEMLEQMEDENV